MFLNEFIPKFSPILVLLGLFGLYTTSFILEPANVSASEINENFEGKWITTEGTILNIRTTKSKTLFFTLKENQNLEIVMFDTKTHNLKKNDRVWIKGKVSIYRGKTEIIAKEIKKIVD